MSRRFEVILNQLVRATGEGYFTYRLVRGERIGGKVRQITVLNLGRNFSVKPED